MLHDDDDDNETDKHRFHSESELTDQYFAVFFLVNVLIAKHVARS